MEPIGRFGQHAQIEISRKMYFNFVNALSYVYRTQGPWEWGYDAAKQIYQEHYWNVIRGDELPPGIDISIFDCAVHTGTNRAIEMAQFVIGHEMTGMMGETTLNDISKYPRMKFIENYAKERLTYYESLPSWDRECTDWNRRIKIIVNLSVNYF